MRIITGTGGLIQTSVTGEISGGGVALGALLSGGTYRQVSATAVFADDDNDASIMGIGLNLIDPNKAILLNFVVIRVTNSQDFTWGISLNPTYSGAPAAPSFVAVPGSTAAEYAVGGTTLGAKVEFSDQGITLFHSKYLSASTGLDIIDAESISGIQSGTGYTIKGLIDQLAIWINSHGNNATMDIDLSFVELDVT